MKGGEVERERGAGRDRLDDDAVVTKFVKKASGSEAYRQSVQVPVKATYIRLV